ncbi:MAG: ABC transporter ATP-binding protein [Chloroflexi bacterium]|nr:ABC transporter ATP-binding protein [Ktedonobacteraceae bacterium]MBV9708027.1 ABC transporter ATP-binding protein [Chloroflexota bacterium]
MYLHIKQLSKSYGSRRVVSNIDLEMEEGEILSLLGPSGCGKTTILRMIAGLVAPDGGWIQVGDQVFYDGKREVPIEERRLGMVFQDYALWPHMTVARNIAFGLRLRRSPSREIAKRVEELLELVSLPGFGDRYPHQLSGGQQQRVALARALATQPRLLLLDEPLSSLDTALRESMRAELVQIFHHLKITTINVTHDQTEAMSMSDRIMVLRDGMVQQIGTPAELYLTPINTFVASFMGPANLLSGEIVGGDAQTHRVTLRVSGRGADGQLVSGQTSSAIRQRLNEHASLLCRPDDIHVHPESHAFGHTNVLKGTVFYSSFVGGRWHTLVRLEGEQQSSPILAYAPFQPREQQQVWLELPPEQCRIVPE